MKLYKDREKCVSEIKKRLNSDDIIYFDFNADKTYFTAIYAESLSDKTMLGKQVIEPLQKTASFSSINDVMKSVTLPETDTLNTFADCIDKIIAGDAVILINGFDQAVSVSTKKPSARAVTEPPTASILKGPREGFVENSQTNMSLIRQRLKTPDLKYEKLTVGKQSKTTVGLVYISSIANPKLVNDFPNEYQEILVSQGEFTQPTLALLMDEIKVSSIKIEKPMDAYVEFVSGKTPFFLGTQRDVHRLERRGFEVKVKPLNAYNDLSCGLPMYVSRRKTG